MTAFVQKYASYIVSFPKKGKKKKEKDAFSALSLS